MSDSTRSDRSFPLRTVVGGIVAMFLAFGVGRFAYTPILPLMRGQAGLAIDQAGYLASLMYLGYLSGTLAVTRLAGRFERRRLLLGGLAGLVLACAAMSFAAGFAGWSLVMFAIGICSALIFLATLSLVLEEFLAYGAGWLTALLYAGIGLAIVTIGLAVPQLGHFYGWRAAWHLVALLALAGAIVCHLLLRPRHGGTRRESSLQPAWQRPGARRAARLLFLAYTLLGFAYTIGGTFMASMLTEVTGLAAQAQLGWVLIGAMVIPSCVAWPLLAGRIGEVRTIGLLLAQLALANLIVVVWQTPAGVMVAAALFGSSFLAIPGLVLGELGRLAGGEKDRVTGFATILFGIAMVLGPATGGLVARLWGSFDPALLLAAAVLLVAAIVSQVARRATPPAVAAWSAARAASETEH